MSPLVVSNVLMLAVGLEERKNMEVRALVAEEATFEGPREYSMDVCNKEEEEEKQSAVLQLELELGKTLFPGVRRHLGALHLWFENAALCWARCCYNWLE